MANENKVMFIYLCCNYLSIYKLCNELGERYQKLLSKNEQFLLNLLEKLLKFRLCYLVA